MSGASAGIGKEFARQLDSWVLRVIIVARRQAALDAFAAELEAASKVRVRSIALGLAADGSPARLAELTSDVELAWLC